MDCNSQSDSARNHQSSYLDQTASHLAAVWQRPADIEPVEWAIRYLGVLRDLAPQPRWISLTHIADPPGEALVWMGRSIHLVNRRLGEILEELLGCFEVNHRPRVQILAAPIAPQAGVDGFCCCDRSGPTGPVTVPTTLMVDPGRIVAADWPGLVAHELAHGMVGAGHGAEFERAIAHLCLAQDLPLPAPDLDVDALKAWPPCRRAPHPERFWLGQ